MHKLIPFEIQKPTLSLSGDLKNEYEKLILSFEIQDSNKSIELTKLFSFSGAEIHREDNLWMDTCFEMFLKVGGGTNYYEFNFSLKPAWNVYAFTDYRKPNPPKASDDFRLSRFSWTGHRLEIEIIPKEPLPEFEASLTAILKEKSGTKHYFALAHLGEKPDFHLPKSFILKR